MHVLYVIDSLIASGGAEQSLAAMAPLLVERGVRLDVADLTDRPGLQSRLADAGVGLFPLPGPRASAAFRIDRLIRRRRPDLVHTTLFEADVAGRLAALGTRTPVVGSLVNASYGPDHVHDPALRWWKVRAGQAVDATTARAVVRFHAVAAHVADSMSTRLLIPRSRIDVIPRGRDPVALGMRTAERRESVRAGLGLSPGTRLVLAAARHERQKGLDVLVEALPEVLRRVPQAVVVIAGREGNQTPLLRRAAEKGGVSGSVMFLGPRDDVADLMAAADVVVLPSRWEGIPGTLLEALALEAPIVASDLPGVRAVVDEGREVLGRLVPPEQPASLAEALVATLEGPVAATELARRGRARFMGHFTLARTVEQMHEFYGRSLVAARAGPRR